MNSSGYNQEGDLVFDIRLRKKLVQEYEALGHKDPLAFCIMWYEQAKSSCESKKNRAVLEVLDRIDDANMNHYSKRCYT